MIPPPPEHDPEIPVGVLPRPEDDPEFANGTSPKPPHDPYEALRLPDYRRYMMACVASAIGMEVTTVAVGWEIYDRTKSWLALGYIGLAQIIPVFFLALPAGHAVDRHSRVRIFIAAEAVIAAAALGLAFFSFARGPIWLAYACLTLMGIGQSYLRPARWALMPQIVPPEKLEGAATWNSSTWLLAAIVGPPIGGTLIKVSGGTLVPYLLTAALTVIASLLIVRIKVGRTTAPAEKKSLGSYLAGFRFVWENPLILATITLDLFAVLLGGAQALLPAFSKEILHVDAQGLGWLKAAESLGSMAMVFVLAHRPPFRRAGPTLLGAVAVFGLAMIGFGFSTNAYLSFALLVLAGAADNISVVVRTTLVQLLTPDAMRGRVSAVNSLFIGTSNELGSFESGAVAYQFGLVASVVGGGIGTLAVVLLVAYAWPQLRRLGPLRPEKA